VRNTIFLQIAEDKEFSGNLMLPRRDDVQFFGGQIERVQTDEHLKQFHIVEQSISQLQAQVGRQRPEFVRAPDPSNDFQALIDKAHQRAMQLEEQFGLL